MPINSKCVFFGENPTSKNHCNIYLWNPSAGETVELNLLILLRLAQRLCWFTSYIPSHSRIIQDLIPKGFRSINLHRLIFQLKDLEKCHPLFLTGHSWRCPYSIPLTVSIGPQIFSLNWHMLREEIFIFLLTM